MEGVVRSTSLGTAYLIADGGLTERLLSSGAEWLVVWVAVLAASLAVVVYVIGKFRGEAVQQEPAASELISKFREMHSRGELSDEEFRTIKTNLAPQLKQELKDNGQTG